MDQYSSQEIKQRLIESGGRITLDLGLGRIAGQIVVLLYLSREEISLDAIGENLELSKASVSIAARQLEKLGMIVRVWKKGDRKCYYRTADNFLQAMQKGIVEYVRQKMKGVEKEIDLATGLLQAAGSKEQGNQEFQFLNRRVARAKVLTQRARKIMENPLVKMLAG